MPDSGQQWYTNKELFEQIIELQNEMRETRSAIKKYNGLYEKLYSVQERVQKIENQAEGKRTLGGDIRLWSGWIFAFISLIVAIYTRVF